jgi:hypothetical protein
MSNGESTKHRAIVESVRGDGKTPEILEQRELTGGEIAGYVTKNAVQRARQAEQTINDIWMVITLDGVYMATI